MEENFYQQNCDTDFAVLEIKILSAELSRSTNSFYKMDPYWTLSHIDSGSEIRTEKWKKGSKTPIWDYNTSMLINDSMASDMKFHLSVYNKNSFGKDSLIGDNILTLDYIIQIKMEEGQFDIYYKNKQVGKVFIHFNYKDGTEPENESLQVHNSDTFNQESDQDFAFAQNEDIDANHDLNYEYSPVKKPKVENSSRREVNKENIIAIDNSLSPLEANLAINKTPMWFKFDSQDVFQFNFDEMWYDSVGVGNPQQLGSHIRAAELPDSSFLVTGGQVSGSFTKEAFHFYDRKFYHKNCMITDRANHCTLYHKGFVFCLGGRNDTGAIDEWEALDMNTNEWVPIPSMPARRFNAGWCKVGTSQIYIFGGTTERIYQDDIEEDINTCQIDCYNIDTSQWDTIPLSLSNPLSLSICIQVGESEVLILGGKEANGICADEVTRINLNTYEKSSQEKLSTPVFSIYPAVYKNELIYIQNSGTETTNVPDPMIYPYTCNE